MKLGCARLEDEHDAVHAVAQAGRWRAILKDVAKMTAATAAVYGCPHHPEGPVLGCADRLIQRGPEAGPSGTAVKFGGRRKEIEITACAGKIPSSMLVEEGTRERLLGFALAKDGILIPCKQLVPFRIGMRDGKGFGCARCRDPPRKGRCG